MRAVDTVAWTETLGVGRKELPWALKGKARQLLDFTRRSRASGRLWRRDRTRSSP